MTCPHCGAENTAGVKFCRSCGLALDNSCRKCGHAAGQDDRFCTACGQPLVMPESSPDARRQALQTKQYSPEEIEELLVLRRLTKKQEIASKTLNQDDVDKLFG